MKIKIVSIQFLLLALSFLVPFLSQAQPGFGDDVDDVPIDGSLTLLIAAGIGYGVKKIWHYNNLKSKTSHL